MAYGRNRDRKKTTDGAKTASQSQAEPYSPTKFRVCEVLQTWARSPENTGFAGRPVGITPLLSWSRCPQSGRSSGVAPDCRPQLEKFLVVATVAVRHPRSLGIKRLG